MSTTQENCASTLPAYLNANYIERALQEQFSQQHQQLVGKVQSDNENLPASNGRIQVSSCDFQLATVAGENFCSAIYRARARFTLGNGENVKSNGDGEKRNANGNGKSNAEPREVSLIIKDLIMEIADLGSNEYEMYRDVLPEMTRILQRAQTNEASTSAKLGPDCLLCERGARETYVLEDLGALGYRSADRFAGLDLEHARVLLRKMAQFHAASLIYVQKFPEQAAALGCSHFAKEESDFAYQVISSSGMETAISVAEQWTDFAEIVAKMRNNIADRFRARMAHATKPENSRVPVIIHGDLWVNNALFSYQVNGVETPQDVLMVDFQNCFVASPGFDINFFLYTSVQLEVIKAHRYELLRYYYTHFKSTLEQCGATDIPTWQIIVEEIRNCEYCGYYAVLCELPICCLKREASLGFTAETLGDMAAMSAKYQVMYENPRVRETVRWALDHFNELGILD